jgi:hypothetical protein
MTEQTISASYTMDQIDKLLSYEKMYSVSIRQQQRIEFKSDTVIIDFEKPAFWIVAPMIEPSPELRDEFMAWDVASDEDLIKFETSLLHNE